MIEEYHDGGYHGQPRRYSRRRGSANAPSNLFLQGREGRVPGQAVDGSEPAGEETKEEHGDSARGPSRGVMAHGSCPVSECTSRFASLFCLARPVRPWIWLGLEDRSRRLGFCRCHGSVCGGQRGIGYFYEHGIFDVLRLIQGEAVDEDRTEHESNGHDLECGGLKMLNGADERLDDEPDDLDNGDELDYPIALPTAFQLIFGYRRTINVTVFDELPQPIWRALRFLFCRRTGPEAFGMGELRVRQRPRSMTLIAQVPQ